ncbi:hypothetical protein GCM10009682_08840 [Luedemannella flava]|uniref:Uncharacterized protein n=1 Tax=Luedemannella flava TaxID=349316 RepID=A0ABN2LJS3_9ACTN
MGGGGYTPGWGAVGSGVGSLMIILGARCEGVGRRRYATSPPSSPDAPTGRILDLYTT